MCTITQILWDQILEQAELTLNLMRQATADPIKSAWEYLHGRPFNYDATPLVPLEIPVIVHNKPSQRKLWGYRRRYGFSAGATLNSYRCQQAIDADTKEVSITDTVKFHQQYLTRPSLTPTDHLIHALHTLISAMYHTPSVNSEHQLPAINNLRCLFHTWRDTKTTTSPKPNYVPPLTPSYVTCPPQDSHVENPSHPSEAHP